MIAIDLWDWLLVKVPSLDLKRLVFFLLSFSLLYLIVFHPPQSHFIKSFFLCVFDDVLCVLDDVTLWKCTFFYLWHFLIFIGNILPGLVLSFLSDFTLFCLILLLKWFKLLFSQRIVHQSSFLWDRSWLLLLVQWWVSIKWYL